MQTYHTPSPPGAPVPPPATHNPFDCAESHAEIYSQMSGRERLYLSTCGRRVQTWTGQILAGPEIAIAVEWSRVMDHHVPEVISAVASNGTQIVGLEKRDLAKFLQAHSHLNFIVADSARVFWMLMQCCTQAGIDSGFLWNKLSWGFTDVVLLDTLLRLPRPPGALIVPRTLYSIASELTGVHTLLPALRSQLGKLMQWRRCRAEMNEYGFLAGEAQGLFLVAQLLRQLEVYGHPELFVSAQEQLGERWFDILQRILLRAGIARQCIYQNGLAIDPIACVDHKTRLLVEAGKVAERLRKNRKTKDLFGPDRAGESNTSINMDGARLIKLLAKVQCKYPLLPEVSGLPDGLHWVHPSLLSWYGDYEISFKDVALFKMDLRLYDDMRIGKDDRLRLRYINLPQTQQLISAFDYILQQGYSRHLRTGSHHALLLACVVPGADMHLDLAAALTLSASLELSRRGYRVVAHTEGSLVIEAEGEQLTLESQRLVEKVIADHLALFLKQPDQVVTVCHRVCGWDEVEHYLLKDEARAKLGKPPWGA